jgi:hypothetical protein
LKAIYRTNFEIRDKQTPTTLADALANVCWAWLFHPKRGYPVPSPRPSGCTSMPQLGTPTGPHAEAIAVADNGTLSWGLRLTHPDRTNPTVQWHTELGIERTGDNRVFFSCSLYFGRTQKSIAPLYQPVSRPRVVLDILAKFQGYGAFRLTSKPLLLKANPEYAKALVNLLVDNRRQHPVVYVSLHQQSGRFFFDVTRLAEHLAGNAYVVVSESRDADRMFNDQLPRELRAFDGAVRLYWPGFSLKANPFAHPLWTKHRIVTIQTRGSEAFSKRLLSEIAAVSVTSSPDSLLTWAKIEEASRRLAIEHAKAAQNDKELLKLYEEDNVTLRVKVAALEKELQSKGEELYRARARITAFENAAQDPDTCDKLPPVETVTEAIEQALTRWPDQLIYQPNTKSEGDESPFQPATEVLQALEWLATVYHASKLSKLTVTDLDASIREKIPGWGYSAHQSQTSKGRFKEEYQCQWEGRTYDITAHVGRGSSTRPEETIRIAFDWDKPRKKIVIGYIGQHQKNTKS